MASLNRKDKKELYTAIRHSDLDVIKDVLSNRNIDFTIEELEGVLFQAVRRQNYDSFVAVVKNSVTHPALDNDLFIYTLLSSVIDDHDTNPAVGGKIFQYLLSYPSVDKLAPGEINQLKLSAEMIEENDGFKCALISILADHIAGKDNVETEDYEEFFDESVKSSLSRFLATPPEQLAMPEVEGMRSVSPIRIEINRNDVKGLGQVDTLESTLDSIKERKMRGSV